MDTTVIVRPPESKPKIEPQVTKIRNLSLISRETKKSSDKLRKIFESGSYQKNTQVKILNRYKAKLDRIEKREDDKRKKKSPKISFKQPKLKQFKGSFFDPKSSDDPLKAIGLLAAFNAVDKVVQKDFAAAIGPALVAGGIFLGPTLLSLAASRFKGAKTSGIDSTQGPSKIPWWQKNTSSLSRSNQSYSKFISGSANIGDRARLLRRGLITPRQALSKGGPEALSTANKSGKIAKAFAKFGGSIIPGVGAVIGAADATARALSGDVTGSAIAGTAAGLDAFAAASAATGIGLPLAGLASIASFTLDLTNLVRDLTGISSSEEERNKDRLKEKTKEQKKLVEKEKEEKQQLTFSKTLNSYDAAIKKFEEFSKNFKSPKEVVSELTEGGPPTPPTTGPGASNPYTGPIDKDSFFPLPGGTLSTSAVGVPGGEYGAQRSYGGHSGQDIGGLPGNSPVVAWKTGTVTVEPGLEGPDNIITIDHGNGVYTKYKHVIADVKTGDIVYGGQQIARLLPGKEEVPGRIYDTHLHFEVWRNGRHVNPNPDISASQKISSPLSKLRAEEQHKKTSQPQISPPSQPDAMREIHFRDATPEQRRKVVEALEKKKEIEFTVNGKKYFFKVENGAVKVFRPKSESGILGMIGIPEEIDLSGNKNLAIRNAMLEKVRSMYKVTDQSPTFQSVLKGYTEESITTPPPKSRGNIEQNLSYQEGYSSGPILVPFAVPQQTPVERPQVQSRSIALSEPSELGLLNRFYKKILLNTIV